MKLKPLIILVAVLAALAAVAFWRNRPAASAEADPRVGQPVVSRDTLGAMRGLFLEWNGSTVEVRAGADGQWTVPGYHDLPADFGKLATFADNLQSAKVQRFVTANPERIARLGFGSDRVELRDAAGKALWSVKLGRNADNGGRFIQFGDESRAYLANLNAWFDNVPRNWARAQLLDVKTDQVASLTIAFPEDEPLTVTRGEGATGWTAMGLPEGKTLKSFEVDGVLSRLTGLRFSETSAPDDADAVAAREHARTFTVTLKDGTVYTVALGRRPAPPAPANAEVVTPAQSIDAEGKPVTAEPPAAAATPSATSEAKPGPVYAFVTSNRADAPINALMQRRAFQVGEWSLTGMPANRAALLQDAPPPPPAPAAAEPAADAAPSSAPAPAPDAPPPPG